MKDLMHKLNTMIALEDDPYSPRAQECKDLKTAGHFIEVYSAPSEEIADFRRRVMELWENPGFAGKNEWQKK